MQISTLRRVIEAMGGELVISAKFPERVVELKSPTAVARSSARKPKATVAV
jgi:hypothetical protein